MLAASPKTKPLPATRPSPWRKQVLQKAPSRDHAGPDRDGDPSDPAVDQLALARRTPALISKPSGRTASTIASVYRTARAGPSNVARTTPAVSTSTPRWRPSSSRPPRGAGRRASSTPDRRPMPGPGRADVSVEHDGREHGSRRARGRTLVTNARPRRPRHRRLPPRSRHRDRDLRIDRPGIVSATHRAILG